MTIIALLTTIPNSPIVHRIDEANIVDTCYFAVNYKDVMISSGRLKCDSQFIGIEYSGITKTGKRVMGLLFGGFKFQVKSDPMFTWTIPDSWTLKEAATVPVTYITKCIDDGVVKPLPLKIFELEEMESAFRYLASGKNEGKVVVNMRKDGSSKPISVPAIPQIFFYPEKVYIIVGGLGGMGLELAHWLFSRGARIIILNGRRNIWSKYQKLSMNIWESLKYKAIIDLSDTTTMAGAENLLLEAQNYGPVGGIFNVALVLRDAPVYQQTTQMFEDVCRPKISSSMMQIKVKVIFLGIFNVALVLRDAPVYQQTTQMFEDVCRPKISSSKNMDVLTRKMCPQLDHFVMFSSVVASRGVMGQTNYGYANSALERLCERRKRDKLPGLAIEWGPVADVGVLVTEKFNTKSFGNLLHQKPESCWKALEQFMILGAATCMSCVYKNNQEEAKKEKTPIDIVANILGIANIDTVDKHKPFNNFGVDSLMASEIKQILYQEFNKVIEVEDVRKLNFEKLSEFLDSEKK
uniref:Fatty acid synthase-like n=1 Tax=Diabrotica virgifera virgifera TaxID=50390 RepID=A0A6P7GEP3_DIAVI